MLLPDGYHDVSAGSLAAVVTYLEMTARAPVLVGYGLNHEMRDFRTSRKKNLDLVVCRPRVRHALVSTTN